MKKLSKKTKTGLVALAGVGLAYYFFVYKKGAPKAAALPAAAPKAQAGLGTLGSDGLGTLGGGSLGSLGSCGFGSLC